MSLERTLTSTVNGTTIGIEQTEEQTWLVTWPAFQIIRAEEDTLSEAIEALANFNKEVEAGVLQAIRHGHPDWNHRLAGGPCTRND